MSTDDRQNVKAELELMLATNTKLGRAWATRVELDLRPFPWMRWDLEGEYEAVNSREAWVENVELEGGVASIFADRTTRSFSTTIRGGITFTRNLTLQAYAQIFSAKGHHEGFRRLVAPDAFEPVAYEENPDFNEQSFNLNLVVRWEYLPGSTLFVVWSQARAGESTNYFTSLGDDLEQAFRIAPANVAMVKATLWWSL